jgi:hypothetical protein
VAATGRSGSDEPRSSTSEWNIDGVIPREAWEDRPRDMGLDGRLETLERRLHAAIDRVEDIPLTVERRMASMESELRQRLEAFELSVSAVERVAGTEFPGRLAEFAGALATLEARVSDLGSLVADLAASVAQSRADASGNRQEVVAAARSVEARIVASVHGATDAFLADAQEAITSAHTAGSRLARLTDRVEELHQLLADHRQALHAALQRDRTALLNDVIEITIDALPPRKRRALADKLLVRERRRDAMEEPSSSPPPNTEPPARAALPAAQEDHLPQQVPVRRPDPPGDENPEVAPSDAPIAAPWSEDQERRALREVVLEVPGIGPARAQALANAFHTLERLWIADVEEIVATTDLSGRQAAAVIEHMHNNYDYRS